MEPAKFCQGVLLILCARISGKTCQNDLANKCDNCQMRKCTLLCIALIKVFVIILVKNTLAKE